MDITAPEKQQVTGHKHKKVVDISIPSYAVHVVWDYDIGYGYKQRYDANRIDFLRHSLLFIKLLPACLEIFLIEITLTDYFAVPDYYVEIHRYFTSLFAQWGTPAN